ncbi:hypothetical protein IPC622_22590 [Pseudomonas aeruginosa]|uniref:hypothetical protein n=1 Tax=Pseudomonas aeruginosa TaxID=287 RepID=UPI00053EFB80|nr:hypothetical protein [Pseudomonas aeruginosa]KSK95858.1 hypothetical protein APA35_13675 [Pseudomonas aeruginosa]MCL8044733.1 hypothetical protein [Pseudomonas aeruginosa]TEI44606.1 hypothetical protein IPC634_25935 [Pseudomonas aeruginosa]TEI48692.1 hypothetical protein IPC632_24795 [Pseudomonas aeruginosa]TEI61954.1 hypothetical protein IPC633_20075 [Pseudomonas aeruginosa]
MAFSFAEAKAQLRRAVHSTLGVAAFYQDDSMSTPQPIRVRWHSKIARFGDLESSGWAERIEGIDRVIFAAADARQLNVRYAGRVTIPEYGIELILDAKEPADGPEEEIWLVARP